VATLEDATTFGAATTFGVVTFGASAFLIDLGGDDAAPISKVSGSALKDTDLLRRLSRLLDEDCGPTALTAVVRASC